MLTKENISSLNKSDLLSQKPFIDSFLQREKSHLSVFSFVNIFAWSDFFDFYLKPINGHLCIFAQDRIGCFLYLPPLGEDVSRDTIDQCFQVMAEVNKGSGVTRIENVSAQELQLFPREEFDVFKKGYEYCYFKDDIVYLKGNQFKSKRALYNFFTKNYSTEYLPYTSDWYAACIHLYDRWAQYKISEESGSFSPTPHPEERSDEGSPKILQPFGLQDDQSGITAKNTPTGQISTLADDIDQEMLTENRRVHQLVLKHYRELDLVGRVVTADGQLRGYSFGFALNEKMFCILFEITDRDLKGLPVYIFNRFCADSALHDFSFINVMDDFGLKNIEWTKLSFHPTLLLPLYVVTPKKSL